MKKSVKDINVKGKKILLRVDFNVPVKDGVITDNLRITEALKTITHLLEQGAKLAIISHRGRPAGEVNAKYSMNLCATELSKLLGKKVGFVPACVGPEVKKAVDALSTGEALMLENVRFHAEEESKDDAVRLAFANQLVDGFDMVVNDAFGVSHRKNASSYDMGLKREMVMGFLIEKELYYLGENLGTPKRPFVSIMGGAKVSDKLKIVEQLLPKVDKLLVGGAMAYTFLKAQGLNVGKSLVDKELVGYCGELLKKHGDKIVLPVDSRCASGFDFETMKPKSDITTKTNANMTDDDMGLDIGEKTVDLFHSILSTAKTILWNGPMGIFEAPTTAQGTFSVARMMAVATKNSAITIVGGGDSASAIRMGGFDDQVTHVSTGGGASLEFLSGDELPGISAIANK